jgi:uncharacterized protein YwgA
VTIKFKRGDYLLLLLYAYKQAAITGRTRLQKVAFLFEKEVLKQYKFDKEFDISEIPDFKPYHYGPFSKKVFEFMELFENLGLVEVTEGKNSVDEYDTEIFFDYLLQQGDSEWIDELSEVSLDFVPVYRLTEKGKQYVEAKLWKYLDSAKMQALDKLKKDCVDTPLKLLMKYVYTNYPDFASESRIKEEILKETKWQY